MKIVWVIINLKNGKQLIRPTISNENESKEKLLVNVLADMIIESNKDLTVNDLLGRVKNFQVKEDLREVKPKHAEDRGGSND